MDETVWDRAWRSARILLSLATLAFGVIVIMGGCLNLREGKEDIQTALIIIIPAILVVIGSGISLRRSLREDRRRRRRVKESVMLEHWALHLASRQGGRVTAAELAADRAVAIDEATLVLNRLVAGGQATMNVTDGGVIVYEMTGLLTAEQRAAAELL